MKPERETVIGIPWYRREDWDELLSLFVDAHILHDSYDEWLVSARDVRRQLARRGMVVRKVYLNPAEFAGWCALRGLETNASARSQFAAEAVQRKQGGRR